MISGASAVADRAFVPSASSQQAVSPVPASIPSAMSLDDAYAVVGEMLEYFDAHRLATRAPLAEIILREVKREREACAALARQWCEENKIAAAKAKSREARMSAFGFDHPGMSEMLDGAAIECNAIASAIETRSAETLGSVGEADESAVAKPDAQNMGRS